MISIPTITTRMLIELRMPTMHTRMLMLVTILLEVNAIASANSNPVCINDNYRNDVRQ